MWYSSPIWYYPPTEDGSRIGHATSTDGLTWTKHPDPVLEPGWYGSWGEPVVNFQYDSTDSALEGLTITGGYGQGGVVIEGVTAIISNCTVTENESLSHIGGGIHVGGAGGAQIEHTRIISNAGSGLGISGSSAVSLRNSTVSHNWADGVGGGINMQVNAILHATDSLISHNEAGHGGGIAMWSGSSARLERTDVLSNTAGTANGGIRVEGGCTLDYTDGLVQGNSAYYGKGGIGSRGGTVNLERVTIRGNHVEWGPPHGMGFGGGLGFESGAIVSLTEVLVEDNLADSGAGLDIRSSAEVTLYGVELVGNTAHSTATLRLSDGAHVSGDRVWIQGNVSSGGGVGGLEVVDGSALTLTNALIANNNGGAGGVHQSARLHLSHASVTANQREDGLGGLYISPDSEAAILNSILYFNGTDSLICDAGAACTVESSVLPSLWPGPGNISADPMFVDWPARDHHLSAVSPAIDTADPAHSLDHDADLGSRPSGAGYDMGYDEYTGDPARYDVAVVGASPGGDVQAGRPVTVTADLHNSGDFEEEQVPVLCTIWEDGGLEVYTETGYSGSIAPATYALVEFPDWTPAASGPYTLTCESQLPGDADIGNDSFTRTGTVIAAGGEPDVWTKDNEADTGDVPSDFPFWVSPDIWVRNQPDGGLIHQNPIGLEENTVYVRIRNRGDAPASGQVGVYWDHSRIGWPCKVGEPNVGTIPFSDLAPGEVRLLFIPWTPEEVGHHGLHIVIDADGDPANWDARCSPHLPRWDNNVAWHNVIVFAHWPADDGPAAADLGTVATEQVVVYLANPYEIPKTVDLTVWRGTFPIEGTISLLLGHTLMDRWLAYGSQGSQGVEINEATAVVTVTGQLSATLAGLPLAAGEENEITVSFDAGSEGVYEVQFDAAVDDEFIGGLTYRWIELDTVPPQVVSTSPPHDAVDVALDAPLVITFTEPIGPLSFDLSLDPDPGPTGWLAAWNPAGTVVTVTHPALSAGQTYTADISAGDAFANPVKAYPWSFTTAAIDRWHIYLPVVVRSH
jgi:hypothetical protein